MENKETQDKNKMPNTTTGTAQTGSSTNPAPQTGQSAGAASPGQAFGSGQATQQSRYGSADASREGSQDWDNIKERSAEFADKAKQTVTEAYDKTSRTLNEGYGQAIDYGRENPGKTVLIAFGVGIGVGLLLSNNMSPRSRAGRIVPPVMNALSDIAVQLFR